MEDDDFIHLTLWKKNEFALCFSFEMSEASLFDFSFMETTVREEEKHFLNIL